LRLTGCRNRLGALLTWWLAFTRNIRRERTFTAQQIETLRDVYAAPDTTDPAALPAQALSAVPAPGGQPG
jgi:NADH:ubiquinone reductase (H+-translocating)